MRRLLALPRGAVAREKASRTLLAGCGARRASASRCAVCRGLGGCFRPTHQCRVDDSDTNAPTCSLGSRLLAGSSPRWELTGCVLLCQGRPRQHSVACSRIAQASREVYSPFVTDCCSAMLWPRLPQLQLACHIVPDTVIHLVTNRKDISNSKRSNSWQALFGRAAEHKRQRRKHHTQEDLKRSPTPVVLPEALCIAFLAISEY